MKEGTPGWFGLELETGPDRAARSGQPQSGYISAVSSGTFSVRPADPGPVTASLCGCRGVAPAVVVGCTIRKRRCSDTLMKRRQRTISDEMMAFQHEFVGRGCDGIRTRIVEDLVLVRSLGVLTPAELQLSASFEERRLIKAVRQQVLESGRSLLERLSRSTRKPRSSPFTRTSQPRMENGWTSSCSIAV
jgi:Na+-translocating membrane potential-generating system (MpsC)